MVDVTFGWVKSNNEIKLVLHMENQQRIQSQPCSLGFSLYANILNLPIHKVKALGRGYSPILAMGEECVLFSTI